MQIVCPFMFGLENMHNGNEINADYVLSRVGFISMR